MAVTGLTGASEPPPRARRETSDRVQKRAKAALKIMESGRWVTDDTAYKSRTTAAGTVTRLKRQVAELQNVERECLIQRVRLTKDGWRWWLALRDRIEET